MDIADLERKLGIDGISAEQQMEIISALQQSAAEKIAKAKSESIGKGAELVIQGLKKIKSDMEQKFAQLNGEIQSKVASIQDGQDGKDGKDGRDGRQGPAGSTGPTGRDGVPGRDGVDGANGTGVASARIDFDGSLVITLDNGREINAGEVVPFDVAERIKVITNGGGTSQSVLDTLASLQAQISAISGGLSYQGTWNASTNTPTLTSSSGTSNYYYVVSVSGSTNLNGITDWVAGDWAIYNGTVWQKIDQTNLVISVAGRTGAITLTTADIGGLGTIATQAANNVSITGGSIAGITALTATGNAIISDNSANAALRITQIGAGNALLVEDSANPDSTPFVINASGNVISGYTVPFGTGLSIPAQLGVGNIGNGSGGGIVVAKFRNNGNFGADIELQKSRNSAVGVNGIVGVDDLLGTLNWTGADGTGYIQAASISVRTDGTPNTNDMPGRLVFSTTADGASSPTERLRIASTGAFGLAGANYGTSGQVLTSGGTSATPTWTTPTTGTVTSVTGTSPVASTGGDTPAISLAASYGDTQNPFASKTANFVLAAPNGSAGIPTFRAIVAADVPTLNQNTTGTAASTPKLLTTNFTIEESGGKLLFKYGATTIASMSSTGVITSATDIVANGTP